MDLTRLAALSLALVAAPATALAGNWEKAGEVEGVEIYAREVDGSDVKEMKAYGMIDAPPERVLAVLFDVESYAQTMPYTEVSKAVKKAKNKVWLYTVVNAPLVDRRDYTIEITISRLPDGRLKSEWVPANELGPKVADDTVRVKINNGHWLLQPLEGGKKTKAVYYVNTDPGGSVPKWLVNKANTQAVPDVFLAIRKAVGGGKYANAASPLVEEPAVAAPAAAPSAPAAGPAATPAAAAKP